MNDFFFLKPQLTSVTDNNGICWS